MLRQLDLFHPTYYDLTYGFSFSDFKCPTVLTVYDFIYAIYPKLIEGSEGVIRDQTEAIRKADHIICISKSTENNLLERFPELSAAGGVTRTFLFCYVCSPEPASPIPVSVYRSPVRP